MAFVIDTQGSHKRAINYSLRNNEDCEESDDDFLFIPLKREQHRRSHDECNDYLKLDDSYPSFRDSESAQKINIRKQNALLKSKSKSHFIKSDVMLSTSSTLEPGLEKLEHVPSYLESKRIKQQKRKAEQARSKGFKWFNLPAPEVTEEIKNDIEALQMRSALDPKHFYKKNDMKHVPKYFQIGKVADSPADFYSSRIPKKERKRTLVDDLLADAEFQRQTKRRYKQILYEQQKNTLQYHRQKRREFKKKSTKNGKKKQK